MNKFGEIKQLNSYVYLGPPDHALYETKEFKSLNINVIVNCVANKISYPETHKIRYQIINFPMTTDSRDCLEKLEMIHSKLKEGKKIYIHCMDGISQAPIVMIYYLMVYQKFSFHSAYNLVKKTIGLTTQEDDIVNSLDND
jgi:protein-tyrosine phosphatase